MRIINKYDTKVEFVEIKPGECFMHDNCLFIKMNRTVRVTDTSPNAFCFVDNKEAYVPEACLVTPVDAEIVIRSKGVE